jgi:glycosyltransferase involved in cell wall biosynthesis
MRAMRVLAIVPAFNEARALPSLIRAIHASAPHTTICVVDDGSTDDTAAVAAGLGAEVLRLPFNLGIGGAVQAGYLRARELGVDVAVQVDGDGQHDPAQLERLLAPLRRGEADVVIGSRFLEAGGFRSTLVRRLGIRYLSWFLRLRCGARVTDPTSGFRAANRAAIELFARSYPSDYPEPEAIAIARWSGLRVAEVPVTMLERAHGASSITALRTLYYLAKVSVALVFLPTRPPMAQAPSGEVPT